MCSPDKSKSSATTSTRSSTTTSNTTDSSNNNSKENHDDQNEEEEASPIIYTLQEHCQFLGLKTQSTTLQTNPNPTTLWYCDWTKYFCPHSHDSFLKDVVQDYCQPISSDILQDDWVGLLPISNNNKQRPVRSISLRLRPDAKEATIWKAVHTAFCAVHPKQFQILATPHTHKLNKDYGPSFQAIGADGNVPLWVVVDIGVHKLSWQRRVWIRIYHAQQCPSLMEEELQNKIGGITNQKAILDKMHTPWNVQLKEASSLVQYVVNNQKAPTSPCPKSTPKEMSEFFHTYYTESLGVLEQTGNKNNTSNNNSFPSLAPSDYALLQESVPLVERIWSEIELELGTFNTMTRETKRFGMCGQPTLDKPYCEMLAQVSQQQMLLQLKQDVEDAETVLHDTLQSYYSVQSFIVKDVMRTKYNVDVSDVFFEKKDNENTNNNGVVDYGQTPVALPKRDTEAFPWHAAVRKALDDVTDRIATSCYKHFDPTVSIAMSEDAVQNVMHALQIADNVDQQVFLRQHNRRSMIRLTQTQGPLKRLIMDVLPQQCTAATKNVNIQAAANLRNAVQRVCDLMDPIRGADQVPLVEFTTRSSSGGSGLLILTPQYLMIRNKPILGAMQKHCLPLRDVDVRLTPNHLLSKLTILTSKGEVVAKVTPTTSSSSSSSPVDLKRWVQLIEVLKGLQ